jgi:hypothetical protein
VRGLSLEEMAQQVPLVRFHRMTIIIARELAGYGLRLERCSPLVTFGEAAQPEPAPGEALVKVAAFSVNRGETFQLEGLPRPGGLVRT